VKKIILIIIGIILLSLIAWVYVNYRQNQQDDVTTNDIFVSDENLEKYPE